MSFSLDSLRQQIAGRLQRIRKSKNITQREFADLLYQETGIPYKTSTISAWETGRNSISADLITIMARVLEVPVQFIYGQEDPTAKKEEALVFDPALTEEDKEEVRFFQDFLLWRRSQDHHSKN